MTMGTQAAQGRARLTALGHALIRLTWAPGTAVGVEDARDVLTRSLELVDHVPYAILIDMRGITSLSIGARRAFAADTTVLAAAMLGSTPVDRVLSASAEHAVHPTRFFTEEADALAWLARYLRVS